ncbi:MAG: hypothetical protein WCD76_11615, partial [Pyrinomonadaceae bacterium]
NMSAPQDDAAPAMPKGSADGGPVNKHLREREGWPVEDTGAQLGTEIVPQELLAVPPSSPVQLDDARRPRWSGGELASETEHNKALHEAKPEKAQNWKQRVFPLVAQFGLNALRSGDPLAALGGAGMGLVTGLADPRAANRMRLGQQTAQSDKLLGQLRGQRKEDLNAQEQQADIGVKNANRDWLNKRPALEQNKLDASTLNRERAAVLSNLRLLKGQKIDPRNPKHAALLERAANAGIEVDPTEWNNSKENVTTLHMTDLADPTKRKVVAWNRVTNAQEDLGYDGFQIPLDENGMSEAQRRTDDDRDGARTATERQRTIVNDLSRIRIGQGEQRLNLARDSQDSRLDATTRRELSDAYKLQAEVEKARSDADSYAGLGTYTGDDGKPHRAKWAVQKETDARNKAEALQKRFEGTYGYLLQGAPAAAAPPSSSPTLPRRSAPARRGAAPAAGGLYTVDEVRARARAKGVNEDAAIEAARAKGMLRQ